jgi:hypothetical protein
MEDNKNIILVLLAIFIIVGFVYEPLKKSGINNAQRSSSSIGATNVQNNSGNSQNVSVEEGIKNSEQKIKTLQENVTNDIKNSKHSPYYGKVSASGISGFYGNDPSTEYITLYTNLGKTETVKITGWYLKSEITGYYAVIGGASLLPFPFAKNESGVVLQQGDRVYVVKGFSPIGIPFRTNKCTGYFEEDRTFYPGLPLQCPRPQDEKLPTFSSDYDVNDECVRIIENIPRCTTVNSQFIRDLPDFIPSTFKNYLTTQINYNSCVALHFSDIDFPGNEYRLYLNKIGTLWLKMHDNIILHDENGLVVDTISY